MIRPSRIERAIDGFERRFGKPHLDFACHTAVPIALTPELCYQIWAAFRVDESGGSLNVPWIATADLLLSDLCAEIGPDLYEIRPPIRKVLVKRLEADPRFGKARVKDVASFLLSAVESGARLQDAYSASLAASQTWAALSYSDPDRAASMLAEEVFALSSNDPAGWRRLDSVLRDLSEPLADHAPLRSLVSAMTAYSAGKKAPLAEHLRSYGQTISVAGRELAVPEEALRQVAAAKPPPTLQSLEDAPVPPGEQLQKQEPRLPALDLPNVAELSPEVEDPSKQGASPLSGPAPLKVYVVGGFGKVLPEPVHAFAARLGEALARSGYVLVTQKHSQIGEITDAAFKKALPADADHDRRLVLWMNEGRRVVSHMDDSPPGQMDMVDAFSHKAMTMSDVVIGIGELMRIDLSNNPLARRKHILPLRWPDEPYFNRSPLPNESEKPFWLTRRFLDILATRSTLDFPPERWILPLIELANPDQERQCREYHDSLADLLLISDPVIAFSEDPAIHQYWSSIVEVGTGDPKSRISDQVPKWFADRAAAMPIWVLYDLTQIETLNQWPHRERIKASLRDALAPHLKDYLPDIAIGMLTGSTTLVSIEELVALFHTVRGQFSNDKKYIKWLEPIVVKWAAHLLSEPDDEDDLIDSMVSLLRSAAASAEAAVANPLSPKIFWGDELLAAWLWVCAFPDSYEPSDAAFGWEISPELYLFVRSQIAVFENATSSTKRERARTTLLRARRHWREHPDKRSPKGLSLIEACLGPDSTPGQAT